MIYKYFHSRYLPKVTIQKSIINLSNLSQEKHSVNLVFFIHEAKE